MSTQSVGPSPHQSLECIFPCDGPHLLAGLMTACPSLPFVLPSRRGAKSILWYHSQPTASVHFPPLVVARPPSYALRQSKNMLHLQPTTELKQAAVSSSQPRARTPEPESRLRAIHKTHTHIKIGARTPCTCLSPCTLSVCIHYKNSISRLLVRYAYNPVCETNTIALLLLQLPSNLHCLLSFQLSRRTRALAVRGRSPEKDRVD